MSGLGGLLEMAQPFLLKALLSFALIVIGVIASFAVRKGISAVFDGRELKVLRKEAMRVSKSVPFSNSFRDAVDRCSEHADVLRALIRFAPSSSKYDVSEAAMTLHYARGFGLELSLTGDGLTLGHLEVYEVLTQALLKRHHDENNGKRMTVDGKAWVAMTKDVALAMEYLNEHPMILPIIRDRGVTDVREALKVEKMLKSCDAPVLSSGML